MLQFRTLLRHVCTLLHRRPLISQCQVRKYISNFPRRHVLFSSRVLLISSAPAASKFSQRSLSIITVRYFRSRICRKYTHFAVNREKCLFFLQKLWNGFWIVYELLYDDRFTALRCNDAYVPFPFYHNYVDDCAIVSRRNV